MARGIVSRRGAGKMSKPWPMPQLLTPRQKVGPCPRGDVVDRARIDEPRDSRGARACEPFAAADRGG